VRVVIAEDAAVIREGLTRLLTDAGHQVLAAVADADALLDAVVRHAPDIAVIDVRMPPGNTDDGLRAAVRIREAHPGTAVLIFSQYVEERYAAELLAGSTRRVGYLLKERVADVADFLAAIERVAAGGTALDPEVVSQIFAHSRRRAVLQTLTPREREVLAAMAEGSSNTAIAARLMISDGAVEKHASNIFAKLGLTPTNAENRRVLAVLTYLGVHHAP
jgi:DNA-binding NarL/FixJ family response regulator